MSFAVFQHWDKAITSCKYFGKRPLLARRLTDLSKMFSGDSDDRPLALHRQQKVHGCKYFNLSSVSGYCFLRHWPD